MCCRTAMIRVSVGANTDVKPTSPMPQPDPEKLQPDSAVSSPGADSNSMLQPKADMLDPDSVGSDAEPPDDEDEPEEDADYGETDADDMGCPDAAADAEAERPTTERGCDVRADARAIKHMKAPGMEHVRWRRDDGADLTPEVADMWRTEQAVLGSASTAGPTIITKLSDMWLTE